MGIPFTPRTSPAAWLGHEERRKRDWIHELSEQEAADIDAALAHAKRTGKALAALHRDDFPLPRLQPAIARCMSELDRGRGFVLLRGVPVWRYSEADAALVYWGLGLHMGTAVSQNAAGDLLGHVRDTGADPKDPSVRLYKTRDRSAFTATARTSSAYCVSSRRSRAA